MAQGDDRPAVALVTGAGSGIGRAICLALAADGYRVAAGDVEDAAARDTVGLVEAAGGRAWPVTLDVSDPGAWQRALQELSSPLRVLVNNAGICIGVPLTDMSIEDWRRQMSVNLDGTFLGLRFGIPALAAAGGGAVVNVASVAGIRGIPGLAGYCASKAGIILLSKSAALECAAQGNGVRVNVVLPGAVETPLWSKIDHGGVMPSQDEAREAAMILRRAGAEAATPLGRAGTPAEVADVVSFLVSHRARFVTGAELLVDGGAAAGA